MEESRPSNPISPSMRKVLDDIVASKSERDGAAAKLQAAHAASSAVTCSHGTTHDDLIACLERQNAQLQVLLQETAKQTLLLSEILARLPVDSSPVLASEARHERG